MTDVEKKVLRILWNLYKTAWVRPDVKRISWLSGGTVEQLRKIVFCLVKDGYVEVRKDELRVIQGLEQGASQ
ncbi:hypothetical protein AV654_33240 [Paenibacillus elgii]|uniref:MarR family transcriptional regulator n=1 Tax=Paenibacillus elgii TaxID=189691 RepID=A0A163TZZ4_9BACL|nr:hypothetical protein [Paenibacillus elgii]KZE72633.1 hypothetical protein AV654_33240 [Paenibacillus elgii]